MKTSYLNNVRRLLKMALFIFFDLVIAVNPVKSAETGVYDTKYYSASICRNATPEKYSYGTTYTDLGYVENKRSDRSLTVVCPLIRDTSKSKLVLGGIGVYYTDSHPSENINCHVTSHRMKGEVNLVSKKILSDDISSGSLWLGIPVETKDTDSFFYLTCSIPPKSKSGDLSRIKSITVTEFIR